MIQRLLSPSVRGAVSAPPASQFAASPRFDFRSESADELERLRLLFEQIGWPGAAGLSAGRNVASWHPAGRPIQARQWHRVAWTPELWLTPLDEESYTATGAAVPVTGRDLSLGGLSISHHEPLACRIAALRTTEDAAAPCCVVRLTWCRFSRSRVYLSGGPFLRAEPVGR